jgi:hypothetical protein
MNSSKPRVSESKGDIASPRLAAETGPELDDGAADVRRLEERLAAVESVLAYLVRVSPRLAAVPVVDHLRQSGVVVSPEMELAIKKQTKGGLFSRLSPLER